MQRVSDSEREETMANECDHPRPAWLVRHERRALPIVDWLGARRPLDLILGVCLIIALIATLLHATG